VLYRFNAAEADMLLNLALSNLVECASEYDGRRNKGEQWKLDREDLLTATRIVAELHEPTPSMRGALSKPGAANELGIEMVTAAALEGVDLKKELGDGIDRERAGRPRCRHGRLFTEPCADCSADSPHTPFALAAEEQRAMDEALAKRVGVAGTVADKDFSVSHSADCPVNQPGFVPIEGETHCNCNFGLRLREALGIDRYTIKLG